MMNRGVQEDTCRSSYHDALHLQSWSGLQPSILCAFAVLITLASPPDLLLSPPRRRSCS